MSDESGRRLAADLKVLEDDPELRSRMVEFLEGRITAPDKAMIREAIEKNPKTWWASYHLHWGMSIRNALRVAEFGERETGIENLDNVYIGLVEEAVKE